MTASICRRAFLWILIAVKICGCYCFVYPPSQRIHLQSYGTSNAKLGLKLTIIVFFCDYDTLLGEIAALGI